MTLRQIFTSKIILSTILLLFVMKGLVLSFLIPIFQNPDEQTHYGTIQHWAASEEEKGLERRSLNQPYDANDIRTSNLPEEMVRSAYLGKFDEIKFEKQNMQDFSDPRIENEIIENEWKRYVDTEPTTLSGTKSVYYLVASWLERIFSNESIFVRIFSSRMLAVVFGVATVLLAYLIARKIGFSDRVSLLLTTLVAFQPMLSITAAQVNIDIALIFSFSLFLYAGVCILRDGLGWKNALLAVFAATLGVFSKGPGILLVAMLYPLFAWGAYRKYIESSIMDSRLPARNASHIDAGGRGNDKKKRFFVYLALATIMTAGIAFLAVPKEYLTSITNTSVSSEFDSPLKSLEKYFDKTTDMGEFRDTSLAYWGHFGWLDAPIPRWMLSIINWVEIIGFVAILLYLLTPVILAKAGIRRLLSSWIPDQVRDDKAGWVPERKYLVFFLGMILFLQFAIRFYDWRVFDAAGKILIGQPGRYFLPNIIGHLILVSVGLGIAISWVRVAVGIFSNKTETMFDSEKDFELVMKVLALGMILLGFYAIVNVIIPRYYL